MWNCRLRVKAYRSDWARRWVSSRTCVDLFFFLFFFFFFWVFMWGGGVKGWGVGVCVCVCVCVCVYAHPRMHACTHMRTNASFSGYQSCVWFRMINHILFFSSDSSSWQQIWFWPLKSRHVVERRLWDLRFAMPLKENVWMGLLIRKQLEAIPHRHENSMHLPCESQTDWRGCDAGSVPITQRAKCAEWLTMIKCKRVC